MSDEAFSSSIDFTSIEINPSSLRETLQIVVSQLAQLLTVDCCILHPFKQNIFLGESIIYQKYSAQYSSETKLFRHILEQTSCKSEKIEVINSLADFNALQQADTPQKAQRKQAYQQANIGASLLIPLNQKQELIGVLGLYHCGSSHKWRVEEIQLATMVVQQIILVISQHQAYQQVKALAQREVLINTITAAIRSSLDPQAIFTAITHQLGQVLKVDGCALSLWTKKEQFVECVGLYDCRQTDISPLPQSIVPISDNPVLQKLIETLEPVVFEDINNYPQMTKFDLPLRRNAQALLIVPLIVDGEIIGSISLRQIDHPRHWLWDEIKLAQAVASQAAIAVQQARLYDTTKRQATKLLQSEQRVKQLNQYLTQSVLKRFLPASMVNKVAAGELILDLNPEPRLVTILFSDLVGFTPLASQLGAQGIATLLNEYLEGMTSVVFEYGGTVDKFIGDAVMALFGAPEDLDPTEQVNRAISSARGMHYQLNTLNLRWQTQGLIEQPIRFRCGIHQGNAVVGMFGGGQRSDYTAIGPAVNIADRLQEVAQADTILVSQTVAKFLKSQEIEPVKSLKLKGIKESILMFSVAVNT
ncbi:MAG TPA: adenylate cyclase [Cyanothece sp. UBA12306]|nr:adenylate cyclase [Cyanothece sp. UBA12306]